MVTFSLFASLWKSSSIKSKNLNTNELHIEGFDISNGFKCSDVNKFEKLKKTSREVFELNFYQDQNK